MLLLLAEPENNLWLPHTNELIWATLAFAVVMTLLVRKAGPAIRNAMVARTERIQGELDASTALRTGAEGERDRIREALADSDAEAARIIDEGRETAEKMRADIAARTTADLATIRERFGAELETAKRQAQADLTGDVSRIAASAAEQIVESNLDPATHQSLIEAYIARVGSAN